MKTIARPVVIALGLCAASALAAGGPARGVVAIGGYSGPKATLLAIDDSSLPLRDGLCPYLSRPVVRAEPVLTPNRDNPHATDSVSTHCYGTVLHEGGKFRMWYYGLGWKDNPGHRTDEASILHEGPVCYAESLDGLHWTRPSLGQVMHNGGSDNNAIALPGAETEGAFVIRDDSDPDPARRYKMVYENSSPELPKGHRPVSDTAVSADGITWKGAGRAAVGLEPSSFYLFNGLYTVSAQNTIHVGEGGHRTGRQGFIWVSPDFRRWLPQAGEAFLLPEPVNPNDRGGDRPYVQVHLGVGAASYGNVLVGLYCQWHAEPKPGDWFGIGTTFGDFGLLVSNDGQHFREPVKGHVFLPRQASRAAISPAIRTEEVLTQAGNSILNVGDQTLIYHGRWMNTEKIEDYYAEIAVATLPRDRWGALGLYPGRPDGSVWTAPVTVPATGCGLTLNADGADGIRVEVADERFQLIPEYSGANAGVASGAGGLDCAVAWPKGDLGALAGRPVRLLISLKRGGAVEPRLFAAYLAAD